MSTLINKLNNKPEVAYHEVGSLFTGDDICYPEGWYLFIPEVGAFEVELDTSNAPEVESK
jgi:hypothetical protein